MSDFRISPILLANLDALRKIQQSVVEEDAMRIETDENLTQYANAAPYRLIGRDHKELYELAKKKEKTLEAKEELRILAPEEISEAAGRFEERNDELKSKTLLILRGQLKSSDSSDELLRKIKAIYPDASLADEAMDFLLETSPNQTIYGNLKNAKEAFSKEFATEIKAGKNIAEEAKSFSKQGLGSPTSLRDLYRELILVTKDPLERFAQLTGQFSYDKLNPVLQFLLHSLGSDLKAKGSSIAKGELKTLIDETKSLQGILGVFRFFQSRMSLIQQQFAMQGLELSPKVTFEVLSRLFIQLLAEKYITPDKILKIAQLLNIDRQIAAQIIIYNQMRDGTRQISPRYYRSQKHKEDFLQSFLDVLDTLEDEEDEEEENKDE
jgi:type III secretion protein W